MKKLIAVIIIFTVLLMSGCGNQQKNETSVINNAGTEQQKNKTKKKVVFHYYTGIKLEKLKKELIEAGITGEKLIEFIKKQDEIKTKLMNLTGEYKKIYDLQMTVLPKLVDDKITPNRCRVNDIDVYVSCMVKDNKDINSILKKIPDNLKDTFKKKYYRAYYETSTANLLKPTDDGIALEEKKRAIYNLINNGLITKESVCEQLPEPEMKDYCKQTLKEFKQNQ